MSHNPRKKEKERTAKRDVAKYGAVVGGKYTTLLQITVVLWSRVGLG